MLSLTRVLAGAPAAASNPWFRWQYIRDDHANILSAAREHVTLTVETMVISGIVAIPLAGPASRVPRLAGPIVGVTGALYTVPSLALFALLAPFTGITATTVLIGLVLYALLILVRNTLTGLREVPEEVRDAARGMGYGPTRMLLRVELPIALPSIMTGIRIATVSTVALVTVGVIVGYGGFGTLIIQGLQSNFYRAQIMTGTLGCVLLALVADLLLVLLGRLLAPWRRRLARAAR